MISEKLRQHVHDPALELAQKGSHARLFFGESRQKVRILCNKLADFTA